MKSSLRSAPLSDLTDIAKEDFEDLFEHAPCGYLVLLPDGRIAMANATMSAWTGYSRQELVGKLLRDMLPFAGKIFLETHVLPLLRLQQKVDEIALDFMSKDGSKLPTLANAAERRDAAGHHLSTRLIVLKAVDRRKYERELVFERNQAQQTILAEREVAELREQFIAVLGHDLRNPLASLAAGIRMLNRETVSERRTKTLELMKGSIVRASGLIDNVLDFARGRLGGGLTLEYVADAPLREVLEQVVAELRTIAPDRTIPTNFAINHAVNCDPTRVGQLASNLLGNALTHGASDQPVRVLCETNDDGMHFSVVNGGDPIPAGALEELFQPFFRGKVSKSQQGLGLGLYIASQIAKAHHGSLTATSTADATKFTFSMPLNFIDRI